MAPLLSTYLKINSLIEMMANDCELCEEASRDPGLAFKARGIFLADEEAAAILDVVNDTRDSQLSKRPKEPSDWIESLRSRLTHAAKE